MNIIIRQATVEDALSITQAEQEIAQEPGYFCSQPFELTDKRTRNIISALLKHKNGIYLVAE